MASTIFYVALWVLVGVCCWLFLRRLWPKSSPKEQSTTKQPASTADGAGKDQKAQTAASPATVVIRESAHKKHESHGWSFGTWCGVVFGVIITVLALCLIEPLMAKATWTVASQVYQGWQTSNQQQDAYANRTAAMRSTDTLGTTNSGVPWQTMEVPAWDTSVSDDDQVWSDPACFTTYGMSLQTKVQPSSLGILRQFRSTVSGQWLDEGEADRSHSDCVRFISRKTGGGSFESQPLDYRIVPGDTPT